MTGSVNRVHLSGNLGADPVITTLDDGKRIARFPLATSERWTDKRSGERREKTQWHAVVIWNQHQVKITEAYLTKGSAIYLEGRLQTRKYTDQHGADKYITEVVLQPWGGTLIMLGRLRHNTAPASDPPSQQPDPVNAPLSYAQASGRS